MSSRSSDLRPDEHHPEAKRLAKRDYSFIVTRGEDCVEITFPDLPGCVTYGDTIEEALGLVEEAKLVWISTLLKRGRDVPPPRKEADFSGRFLVRATPDLHQKLAHLAVSSGVSLNQYVVQALSETVGMAYFKHTAENSLDGAEALKWAFLSDKEPISAADEALTQAYSSDSEPISAADENVGRAA